MAETDHAGRNHGGLSEGRRDDRRRARLRRRGRQAGGSLIEGLDAESIDFLDMVFRLERAFKIKIPRGKIVENARGDAARGGVRAERHRHRSRARAVARIPVGGSGRALQDADEGRRHPAPVHAETFCKLVVRAQREAQAA